MKDWSEIIRVVPYPSCTLRIGVGKPKKFRKKFFGKRGKGKFNYALAFHNEDEMGLCFCRDALRPSIIAHEIAHVALYIAHESGWKVNRKTDEPFAYLTEWITQTVYAALKLHKEKILKDELLPKKRFKIYKKLLFSK